MLVNCVAYQNGHKLADVPVEDISEYVCRPDCFVWVGLVDPTPEELTVMQEEFGLHPLALEDARKGHQRPKIEEYGDSLLVSLTTADLDPEAEEGFRLGEVLLFGARNYVLSVRRRSKRGFQEVRDRCEREPENLEHGAGFVVYAIMDAVVDRYFPILDLLETGLENLERDIFRTTPSRASIESLYDLKYRLMLLKHAVAPLVEAVGKLYGGRVPPLAVGSQEYFRDIYDHLARLNGTIDGVRDMLQTAIQVSLTLISLTDSETTKQLAAWGALITVPTLIAGIYGMNFQHMPELSWQYGYPLAIAVMAGVDGWLYVRFKQAGWL